MLALSPVRRDETVTQWVPDPTSGRDRGPAGLLRAWYEVLIRPRDFFSTGISPGDQAPGLVFAICVVLIAETTRLATGPDASPFVTAVGTEDLGQILLLDLLWLGVVIGIVTPLLLHLLAAVGTLVLIPLATERGGVSETVQVIGYATAPCVFAGIPVLELRALCGLYGMVLLLIGIETVHATSRGRAALAAAVPAVAFGYGFRTFSAIGLLLRQWYII